jgi:hypothetical protein
VTTLDPETAKQIVASAIGRPPVRDDPQFAAARGAKVGSPALVYTPAGEPAFWLVPLLAEGLVCGFGQVDMASRLTRLGVLGANPRDQASWIMPSFFESPSAETLAEIGAEYPEATLSRPILSYDASPPRWAWRLEIRVSDQVEAIAFVSPGGWYSRPRGASRPDREGAGY